MSIRHQVRERRWARIIEAATELNPSVFGARSVVFAPHPDDETLGVGGTIAAMVEAGTEVHVVFMTDGRQSHAHLVDPDELAELRKAEALAACKTLGVPAEQAHFFEFPDTKLRENFGQAAEMASELLGALKPTSMFVPYEGDDPPDHLFTNRAARSALKKVDIVPDIYAYPVWFWLHWPWVKVWAGVNVRTLRGIRNTYKAVDGVHGMEDFTLAVDIRRHLDTKRRALACHRSQMEPLVNSPDWSTLPAVSNGEFLEAFFRSHELFLKYRHVEKSLKSVQAQQPTKRL